jgi:peroxiredoxin Q/BCP
LLQFSEKKMLNFTLLFDENHQVAEQYGVWGEKYFMGKSYYGVHRISFLIDEQWVIEHIFYQFKTSQHHEMIYITGFLGN